MHWEPDDQLVAAALGRKLAMSSLSLPDRCWAVAGLTLAGLTAEDIAERLSCSLRLVRSLRAEPMTKVCLWAQREAGAFTDELRLARSELRHVTLSLHAVEADRDRLNARLRRATTHTPPSAFSCGHPRTLYNTYSNGSRTWCRECHRERQAVYRARRRLSSS